jgi:hypothetical protein
MEVLERQERRRRAGVGDRIDDIEHEEAATAAELERDVDALVGEALDKRPTERGEVRDAPQRTGKVEQDGARHVLILWCQPADRGPEAGRDGAALDDAQQARLADAGVAGHEQRRTTPVDHAGESTLDQQEELVTTDEDRADERTDP